MAFTTPVDVANFAAQLLGVPRITTLSDSTKFAREANFAIDKVRAETLQRAVWTSATRRAIMRPIVSTTDLITFLAYSAATTYAVGDIVSSGNLLWISTVASNLANTPGAAGTTPKWIPYYGPVVAPLHDVAVAYVPGDVVYASAVAYIAVAAGTNHAPPNASFWHVIAGATVATLALTLPFPFGYEPNASTLRTIYKLPANWLRMAPQDPKAAGSAHQNWAAGMQYNDWEIEAGYLFTGVDTTPFVMRFVADQVDVASMDPLLCQAWGARLALVLAETMTQAPQKKQEARDEYARIMNIAKAVNAVEAGTTEDEPQEPGVAQPQGR